MSTHGLLIYFDFNTDFLATKNEQQFKKNAHNVLLTHSQYSQYRHLHKFKKKNVFDKCVIFF